MISNLVWDIFEGGVGEGGALYWIDCFGVFSISDYYVLSHHLIYSHYSLKLILLSSHFDTSMSFQVLKKYWLFNCLKVKPWVVLFPSKGNYNLLAESQGETHCQILCTVFPVVHLSWFVTYWDFLLLLISSSKLRHSNAYLNSCKHSLIICIHLQALFLRPVEIILLINCV